MRVLTPIIFLILFLGWIFYRVFIKKDMKKHFNDLYAGLFFVGIWACVYWWISA
ncbi:MAG TPA: hypothetical protein VK476_00245 [Flavobacterium sp.]|nr:hypothetical protein [Flavobacterium sp.]